MLFEFSLNTCCFVREIRKELKANTDSVTTREDRQMTHKADRTRGIQNSRSSMQNEFGKQKVRIKGKSKKSLGLRQRSEKEAQSKPKEITQE